MGDLAVGTLALVFIVLGVLTVGFTWHRLEIVGDDPREHPDLGKCIFVGYGFLVLGVFFGFLSACS